MAITVIPHGFEGLAAGILSAGKSIGEGLKGKEEDPVKLMLANIYRNQEEQKQMGREPSNAEVTGQPTTEQLGQVDTSFKGIQLPQADILDSILKKQTGATTDPLAMRDAAIGALNDQAKIPVKVEEQAALAPGKEREKLGNLELAELTKKFGQSGRVVQAMRNLVGYGKTMDEAGVPNWMEQIISKGGDKLLPFLNDEAQAKYKPILSMMAQLEETKIGQVPIISGQARYVVDLANAIEKTQAQVGGSPDVREELAAQSTRNMMTLVYGIQNGFTSVGKLKELGIDPEGKSEGFESKDAKALLNSIQLTEEQEAAVDEAVDYVLEARPIRRGKMDKSGTQKIGRFTVEVN